MRLNAVKLLGISITINPKKEILEETRKYLEKNSKKTEKPFIIVTPNAEQLVYAQTDSHFVSLLNRADVALPDSVGVVWAGQVLAKNTSVHHIPGVEYMQDLVAMASKEHVPVALIGGRGSLAVETINCLRQKYPELQGIAEDGPEIWVENSELKFQNANEKEYFSGLAKRIRDANVQMVFVGLGPPKQEYFIEQLASHISRLTSGGIVLMSVGGSFDILSGRLPRAPFFVRHMKLEWLWRLILEPWRIFRQLALFKFVFLVLREKLLYT